MNAALPEPTAPRISDDPIRCAFDRRVALMPWRNRRPVPEADIAPLWTELQHSEPSPGPRLTYVHIPFCANHCLFCGFYRNRYRPAESPRYVDLLIDEIRREAELAMVGRVPIRALYLGGGTPTALETPDLVRLITTLRECLPLATDCELTLEGRIAHCDDAKIDACLEAGVNRISIGVQSFDTDVRRRQGRRADHLQVIAFIAGLIARRRAAVVIDLIYGLPGQDPEIWIKDLEIALALEPDGIDAYPLALFPGTPLHKTIRTGRMPPPASLQEQGGYYEQAVKHFKQAGWRQLSNSHWAATPSERNRYNRLIKQGAPTLAYGSGAGGSLGHYSYANTATLADYTAAVQAGRKPVTGIQQADALQALRDRVVGHLETGHLDLTALFAEAALPAAVAEHIVGRIDHWVAAGLAHRREASVDLTTAGRFWSNNLITELNAALSALLQADTPSSHCPIPRNTAMRSTSTTTSEHRQCLRERLADNQDGILEDLARTEGMPLLEVICCLPESHWTRISGGHFTAVMGELAHWGDLTTMVHTQDLILEFKGPIPEGRLGHGFYNLIGRQGLSGHLRPDHCTDIIFLQRPFMSRDTASVQFFNATGECMFKVFLGRDAERRLRPDQLERFAALAARWREDNEVNS